MNPRQLNALLGICRPGTPDAHDPDVASALTQARRDPRHRDYLEKQQAFHASMQQSVRQIPVPAELRARLLRQRKVVKLTPRWWSPATMAAAAAILLLAALAAFWHRPNPEGSFPIFRSRMVSTVLRQYTMDITTNDMAAVRQFLADRHAPSDYALTPALSRLPVTGAGVLRWQGQLASMICLETPGKSTLFLFVVDASAVKGAPGPLPQFQQVNELTTASWTQNGKTYLVAGSEGAEALRGQF